MKIDEAKSIVKQELSKERFEHTLRVAETAVELAKIYKESIYKVELASLLHDYAKCQSDEKLKQQIFDFNLPNHLLGFDKELWHGPVGAMFFKNKFSLQDEEIFRAIYYHTTGTTKMSNIEKIVFVADFIEPGRDFPGINEVRQMAKTNLNEAVLMVLKNTISFLIKKGTQIYPDTFYAYNELTKEINKER